jgi:hypothetical protein
MVDSDGKSGFQAMLVENGVNNSQNCDVSFYVLLALILAGQGFQGACHPLKDNLVGCSDRSNQLSRRKLVTASITGLSIALP